MAMTEAEEKELIEWLAMMFAMLADGRIWDDDFKPRSRFNDFNWEERPWEIKKCLTLPHGTQ